jgi:dipeptidyl aminopeptidase/acylaminoacyl peptidase
MLSTFRRFPFIASLIAGAFLVLSAGFNASYALAQETQVANGPDRARMEEVLKGLNRGRSVGQVAVSPDGKRLAWIQPGQEGSEIRIAQLENLSKSERVTAAAKPEQHCRENDLAWSPDGRALAFFSDCAKPGEQVDLYLAPIDGGVARRLTELKGLVHELTFSPDGSKLAFLYVEGATRPAGALAAMKPPSGVIGEDGVEIQRIGVAAVDAAKPVAPAQPTPANLHVYEFDWSPGSKGLAYVAAEPPGENNWWVAKLYTQTLEGAPTAILAPAEVAGALHGLQIAVPRWSPDGKAIAFIGGLMSDQGSTGGDVWIVSASGGAPVDLTPKRPTSPAWIKWGSNDDLYVSELAGGNAQLVELSIEGGAEHATASGASPVTSFGTVFTIPGSVGDGRMELSLSPSADHKLWAFHSSTFDHAPEIFLSKQEGCPTCRFMNRFVTRISHFNDGVEPAWGKSVSLAWKSDKFDVQGWLLLPKDYDPAKKYPLIVEVHGGPAAAAEAHWGGGGGLSATAFSALGYFVLQPNPRGSYGQGEEFTEANRKDFGYGDLRDILAGVDAVVAKYPVDPNRVGITGWSYGGFMTMFAVTQTNRFKAAVSGAGLSNWQSYYGENSIDQWMIPYFGASVYDDPAVYAKSSAINYIKQVHTPTLVVVGDRDGECPAPQSYEFWHALRDEQVTTQLVVYPNEGHGFVDPAHRRDVMERAVEWFARYMPAGQ